MSEPPGQDAGGFFVSLPRALRSAGRRYASFRNRWYGLPVVLSAVFAVLTVVPFLLNVTVVGIPVGSVLTLQTLILTLVWATAAQSWNLVSGYAGQFSFGHAAFFGLGAYVPILLIGAYGLNPWIGMMIGGSVACVYGLLVGGLCFRFQVAGKYFALATLAFAELLRYVFFNSSLLGGASGFVKPLPREYASGYGLAAFQFSSDLAYYYLILVFLAVATLVSVLVRHSRLGLYLIAVRDDERAAASLGIPTVRYKLAALGTSAFLTALVGTFWAMYFSSIRPEVVFDLQTNIDILLPAVVGGFGTVLGPILGSFVVTPPAEVARQFVDVPGIDWLIYGTFLIFITLYSPAGVVSWPARFGELLSREKE